MTLTGYFFVQAENGIRFVSVALIFFFQAEDGIRDVAVTGVQTCALPICMAAAGKQDLEIASIYDVNRHTAALWRQRVRAAGIGSLWEIQPGRGRKPKYDQEKRDALIAATLETKPKGMTHWSCRTLAKAQGVSHSTVNRLWQLHNLKPHLSRTFKLSRDSKFIEKLTDVVGLNLNPPQKAIVLCVDE